MLSFTISSPTISECNVYMKRVYRVKTTKKTIPSISDAHGAQEPSYNIIKKVTDNEIIILCLPTNTSHALLPLDVWIFAPLKYF